MPERVIATNETIHNLVREAIEKYGPNCDLNFIDVSQVTRMESLFKASRFNGNISEWDVSNVTNMSIMFAGACFNGDISHWIVSNVTDMRSMFADSKFNGDVSNWKVSPETRIDDMFKDSCYTGNFWGQTDRLSLSLCMKTGRKAVARDKYQADLTTIFPKVQFIVTTYAAVVISSVKKDNLRILKDNQVLRMDGEVLD